ncbi:peptidase inhibitor family I36 protein [Streptomyces sp. NPDC014894]|uniref:peptidase inhibitor family I36 protein n=1 Tax=unclassified Streptomyces TaxID=2593676 RepID=UPI0036F94DCC
MRTVTVTAAATALALTALLPGASAASAAAPRLGACPPGALCLWEREGFKGPRHTHELYETGTDGCVPLAGGRTAASLANRTGRPVTVYQSPECDETGEYDTHPGAGSWTPAAPYRIRAFMIRES